MNIRNNLLEGIEFEPSPNVGHEIKPEAIILHYTAGGNHRGSVDWLTSKQSGVSAHVVIGRAGEIIQLVPFDREAYHAGASVLKGREFCNNFSVGIEIANYGPLVYSHGEYRAHNGHIIDVENVFQWHHKNANHFKNAARAGVYWERYTDAQVDAVIEVCKAIRNVYPIMDIVGHDDVAPDRKTDPGPAFPFEIAIQRILGVDDTDTWQAEENPAQASVDTIEAISDPVVIAATEPEALPKTETAKPKQKAKKQEQENHE